MAGSLTIKKVYVQLLPIIRGLDSSGGGGKILLVKWNEGPFKGRYTGMIKETQFQEGPGLSPPNREELKKVASSLLEPLKSLDLRGILDFPDPPPIREYVYVGTLASNSTTPTDSFMGHPTKWFDFDAIPFSQMPEDDEKWYSKVIQDQHKLLTGSFTFGSWGETKLKSFWIKEVEEL